jgi:hypothetical protein
LGCFLRELICDLHSKLKGHKRAETLLQELYESRPLLNLIRHCLP